MFTQNDTAPALTGTALSGTSAANLTGATATAHILRPDRTVISRAATIVDPTAGTWSLTWQDGDLATSGQYAVEIEVTYAGGTRQTFGRTLFRVQAEIA